LHKTVLGRIIEPYILNYQFSWIFYWTSQKNFGRRAVFGRDARLCFDEFLWNNPTQARC